MIRSPRHRRIGAMTLAATLATLTAGSAPTTAASPSGAPGAPTPADAGDHVLAAFSGSIKGLVLLSDTGGGDTRIRITLNGVPKGATRLVGSSDACDTALSASARAFSLTYQKLGWVRATVSGLMEEEGIFFLRSLRLVKPGSPPRQIACRPVEYYVTASPAIAGIKLEDTLITSYSIVQGTRGMIVAGPSTAGTARLRVVLQRMQTGVAYRLVGSSAPCGTAHKASKTVFDRSIPASGWTDGGITHEDSWEQLASFRVFRGSGFSKPSGCIQEDVQVVTQIN